MLGEVEYALGFFFARAQFFLEGIFVEIEIIEIHKAIGAGI